MECNSLRKKRIRFPRMDDTEANDCVDMRIKGCCHGMLCLLFGRRTLALWNPTTRGFKRLAVPLVESGDRSQIFGIGYDPYHHDYKLVVIDGPFYDEKRLLYHIPEKYSVYSWRRNSVQNNIIPQELYFIPIANNAVYLNHLLHWYGEIPDNGSTESPILSYHMGSETFSYLLTPENLIAINGSCVHRGRLCILGRTRRFSFELWVMEENGVGSSWSKLYSWTDWRWSFNVYLKGVNQEGELILNEFMNLLLFRHTKSTCSPDWKTIRNRKTEEELLRSRPTVYVESLASPNIG